MLDRTNFNIQAALLGASAVDGVKPEERPRARHALMLSYAGKRRRAAQKGLDGPYWKAVHPAAVQRARDLRADIGFGRLP